MGLSRTLQEKQTYEDDATRCTSRVHNIPAGCSSSPCHITTKIYAKSFRAEEIGDEPAASRSVDAGRPVSRADALAPRETARLGPRSLDAPSLSSEIQSCLTDEHSVLSTQYSLLRCGRCVQRLLRKYRTRFVLMPVPAQLPSQSALSCPGSYISSMPRVLLFSTDHYALQLEYWQDPWQY